MNSSDEAVEAAHARHDIFNPSAPECSYGEGFRLQPSDHESTVADGHTITNSLRYGCWLRSHDAEVAAAVRAEAVADERVRAAPAQSAAWYEGYEQGIVSAPGRPRSMARNRAWEAAKAEAAKVRLAAGSVPVATPEPDDQSRRDLIVCSHCLLTPAEIDATDHHSGGWCPGPVANPPAEPAAHLGGVRADNAVLDIPAQRRAPERAPITPRTPSQPVTCEHGKTRQHYDFLTGCRCPGPVSVPKESSE